MTVYRSESIVLRERIEHLENENEALRADQPRPSDRFRVTVVCLATVAGSLLFGSGYAVAAAVRRPVTFCSHTTPEQVPRAMAPSVAPPISLYPIRPPCPAGSYLEQPVTGWSRCLETK